MSEDGYSKNFPLNVSGTAAKRKSCKICNKYIYFHQPILLCKCCRHIFHGACLKLSNDTVFNMQQIAWNCKDCCNEHSIKYHCVFCFSEIFISYEKITICKLCRKLAHINCLADEVCVICEPDKRPNLDLVKTGKLPDNLNNYDINVSTDEFFKNQPIFTPFQFFEKNILDCMPDADSLNEQTHLCSSVLNSCNYVSRELYLENTNDIPTDFVSVNIDGARTNFSKLEIFHREFNVNKTIFGYFLSETNVTEGEAQTFFLEGYNKFVLNRIANTNNVLKHKGSGLMTFLSQDFDRVKVFPQLCISSFDLECLTIEVVTKQSKYLLTNIYRSPNGNFESFLRKFEDILEQANNRKDFKTIILGDTNINLYNPNNWRCREYLNCIFSNGFFPLISRATHFVSDRPTLIDHILCNDMSAVKSSSIFRAKISHHLPVCVNIEIDVPGKTNVSKPRIRINEYLLKSFIADLKQMDETIDINTSAESSFSEFFDSFKKSYDRWFVETNDSNFRNANNLRKDWITVGLANSCQTRKELYECWATTRFRSHWNDYIDYSKKLDKLIDKAKYDYFSKKIDENRDDLKKTWRLINNILGRKRQNRLLTFPEEEAAHNFNKYFISIASDLIANTYSNCNAEDESFRDFLTDVKIDEENMLKDLTVTDKDVMFFISKLNNSKSSYFDPKILKHVSYNLSPILSKLFNMCITEGYFPIELKIAKVIPLFKNKGNVTDMVNYRPISMLSIFSKIFEKLLHKSIVDHLDSNQLLNECQYGFRKRRSTLHALLNATENIYNAMDLNLNTLGIFIDFSRAFDTIDHSILLKKLKHYGIQGNMLNILGSYLRNRKQYVSYGGNDSSMLNITCGVPQGSVLGPLLFIIFINDITNISNIPSYVLFADDLNLFLSNACRITLYRNANEILHCLYKYCVSNKLILNFSKCCFIEFGNAFSGDEIFLGVLNHRFMKVDNCKFLGIYINKRLNWEDQINHVISQVSKSCGSLYRVRLHVPHKILKKLYIALVQPYLNYCISIWGSSQTSASMNRLFLLQKKCLRIIAGKTTKVNGIFQHTKPFFSSYGLLTIFNLYTYFTATESMKILRDESPKLLMGNFILSERSLRLIYPKFKREFFKTKSFTFNSSKILNYLLEHDIPYHGVISEAVFKSRLKRHLLAIQSQSRTGDSGWLPCNHNIFSDVAI